MQSPPTEYLTKYGWIGWLVITIATLLKGDKITSIVAGWLTWKKTSAETDGLIIANAKSSGEIVQGIFREMAAAQWKAHKATQKVEELQEIIRRKDQSITDMTHSLETKQKYVEQLEARLRGNGKG